MACSEYTIRPKRAAYQLYTSKTVRAWVLEMGSRPPWFVRGHIVNSLCRIHARTGFFHHETTQRAGFFGSQPRRGLLAPLSGPARWPVPMTGPAASAPWGAIWGVWDMTSNFVGRNEGSAHGSLRKVYSLPTLSAWTGLLSVTSQSGPLDEPWSLPAGRVSESVCKSGSHKLITTPAVTMTQRLGPAAPG